MMKVALLLCVLAAVVMARPEEETYNKRFENFDAKELVSNERLLKSYLLCFLEQGPCTQEGTAFKDVIPEALKTSCAKCTAKHREVGRTVIKGFQSKLPDLWKELTTKLDPNNEYVETLKTFLESTD